MANVIKGNILKESNLIFLNVRHITLALLIFVGFDVHSACYTNQGGATPQTVTINIGKVNVQRDLAVGDVIFTSQTGGTGIALSCSAGTAENGYYREMSLFTTLSSIAHVYQTNVPGVGVRLYTSTGYFDMPAELKSYSNAGAFSFTARTIDLVKTGTITSGTITSGLLGRIYGDGDRVTAVSYNLSTTTVDQLACSIRTPNLTFPIGDVLASSFGNKVGTIPSGAQNTQQLGLNCDAGANINVMLQGTQNPDVSTTSVLALTGQGNADVADGVGVQLLYNGTPLELNTRILLKQSADEQETFPITARYYQTKTSVSTGKANASATLDITYQ